MKNPKLHAPASPADPRGNLDLVCEPGVLRAIENWTGHRDPVLRAIGKGILLGAALIAIATSLSSCTLTISPDGSRTYATDPATFLRAIETIAEK